MSNKLNDKQIQHLYWRAGFGISSLELKTIRSFSKKKIVNLLFEKSKNPKELYINLKQFEKDPRTLTQEEKKELRQLKNKKLLDINTLWFKQMQSSEGVLRERMTLFFQNHFAVQLRMPRVMLHFHNTIRKHTLGNFGDMLLEVSKSPAIIKFLNNRQNRKGHPNENFAREVMELFTLGRDNVYTEKDIKEAARAFTGWDFDRNGSFVFRKNRHDSGSKTILGNTGNYTGDDVIQILLNEKQTARYLVQKIYKYLVNDQIDQKQIEKLTSIFYEANYDITILLTSIFTSDWFYASENIGSKIKSPVDLITGLSRQFYIKYEKPKVLFFAQRKLNQILFYPPNVAGWPGGKYWIDSSTLMIRLKLASIILTNGVIDMQVKEDMPENMMMQSKHKKRTGLSKRIQAKGDLDKFLSHLETENKDALTNFLIQPKLSETAQKIVSQSQENETKDFIVELLSLPEYQLC